jgi:Uma2 family endonuclease
MTMGEPARKRATYEDLRKVPSTMIAQIINGVLYATPRAAPPHASTALAVGTDLSGPFHRKAGGPGGPGGFWVLDEPELHFGEDILVPDIAAWRRDRRPPLPRAAYFELAPDWVCEVLWPSTVRLDRMAKMEIYARQGVPLVWLVDPIGQLVEVFLRDPGRWVRLTVHGGEERVRIPPFEAVELEIGRWWLPEDSGGGAV